MSRTNSLEDMKSGTFPVSRLLNKCKISKFFSWLKELGIAPYR